MIFVFCLLFVFSFFSYNEHIILELETLFKNLQFSKLPARLKDEEDTKIRFLP